MSRFNGETPSLFYAGRTPSNGGVEFRSQGNCVAGGCTQGIRAALQAIMATVEKMGIPGFSVQVEILLIDGTMQTVTFGTGTASPVRLTDTILYWNGLAISLCDIAKLHVLAAPVQATRFDENLMAMLQMIANTGSCCGCGCKPIEVRCNAEMQEFLEKHMGTLTEVGLIGATTSVETVTVPTDITYSDVLVSVGVSTQGADVITSATIHTDTDEVIETITPAAGNVVGNVTTAQTTALLDVSGTTTPVSAPVVPTPTTVVNSVAPVPVSDIVTQFTYDTTPAMYGVTPTPTPVVTGFTSPGNYTGVITGVTGVSSVTPATVNMPTFTAVGSGILEIIINPGDLGETEEGRPIPQVATPFQVLLGGVAGNTISYTGTTVIRPLPGTSGNVLGGITGTPATSTITTPGTPSTGSALSGVTPLTTSVVNIIDFEPVDGNLLGRVGTSTIGTVASQPATVQAITGLVKTPVTFNAVGTVTPTPINTLFTTTTVDAVTQATLDPTTVNAVTQVFLNPHSQRMVQEVDTETIQVAVADTESINGSVTAVGNGIMAVDNTDGNLSVYNVCDVTSAQS